MNPAALAFAAFLTAAIGTLGGLGGAILLVPILVLSGMEAKFAAPLGLVSVAAGSLAAAPQQLRARVVNHRLGVATEIVASSAALVGALVSGLIGQSLLAVLLGGVALVAAFFGGRRKGIRNLPDPSATAGRTPAMMKSKRPLKRLLHMSSSQRCPKATALFWASAACACQAVSASASRLPALC